MKIKDMWLSYKAILPKEAGRHQIIETRRAFYAGVWAVLTMELHLSDDDDRAVNTVKGWLDECQAFRDSVTAGAEDDV